MKKVKIMLLSLALFAVIGGALAFKAKFGQDFCVTSAYSDNGGPSGAVRYYCAFPIGAPTTTTQGTVSINATDGTGTPLNVCTALPDAGGNCVKNLPILTTTASN